MAQAKMKFGIDLGTTNSAICKMESGEPVIKKTDTLKDTLPSCVSFTKKKIAKVGDSAYNDLRQDKSRATKKWSNDRENVFIEFKRNMGTDKSYESSNMGETFSPEQLSAEVLKALKSFIGDENITSAVITIPAKFKADQIAATKRAAQKAGIEHCELLQEPIAASMAYGLSASNKNGQWLVFDFGGGTFDVALIKVEDGIMQVKDTEGDNYLGGKNLDYAIVDSIIIPYLKENYSITNIMENETTRNILRDAMKFYAEQAKNQLSFKPQADITSQLDEFGEDDEGEEIELDMVITQEQLASVLTLVFQKAIDITKQLLKRNGLSGSDLDKLILVGGSFDSSKGEFRLCGVTAGVGGCSYMSYPKVPAKVEELCSILREKQKNMETFRERYELSFNAHLNLVTVHPWVDGNGRTARLLMNYIQFCHHLFPTKIFKEDRGDYILSLRQSQEDENSQPFLDFMAAQLKKSFASEIEKYNTGRKKGFNLMF